MKVKYFGLIFVCIIFLNLVSSADVTDCGVLSTENTTYVLQNNVNTTTTCFNVTAQNVTLDLNGFNVVYGNQSDSATFYGVYSNQNYTNVLNGSIRRGTSASSTNPRYGIGFDKAYFGEIEDMNISYNYWGIYLMSNSNFNNLDNLTVVNNTNLGFFVASSNNNFSNIISNQNAAGMQFGDNAINSTLINVTTSFNTGSGIVVFSRNNTLLNITSNNNSVYGIQLNSANNNSLTNVIVNNNSQHGIYIYPRSNDSILTNITANYNLQNGILISSGRNNTLTNITANYNSINGILFNVGVINNSIRNAILSNNVENGLRLYFSENSTFVNLTSTSNLESGLDLSSSGNTFSNCNFTNNTKNLYFSSVDYLSFFNNSMDTSNVIDYNYIIYSNYSISNYTFNSTNLPNAGIIVCANCYNVTYKDVSLNADNDFGFYFHTTNYSLIQNITSNSKRQQGIYLYSSHNNNLTNLISKDNTYYGIDLEQAHNNTLLNITSSNNSYGVFLQYCNNTYLTNSSFSSNSGPGIYSSDSYNNSFLNLNSSFNNEGIYMSGGGYSLLNNITATLNAIGINFDSRNNNLSNSLINANNYGVYLSASNYNILNNLTVIDSSYDGINATSGAAVFFASSSYNLLNNSQVRRNYNIAFYFVGASQNNITSNIIENHSNGGMKFSTSTGNRIYNNFFNSTLNYNESGSANNFFNTTKTLGTNIVGGDYIGGNYWGFLNGTGFSETCTDSDGDDICDTAYNLSDGSYDYLPLKLISFTLPTLPASPYTGGSSGTYSSSTTSATAQKETQPISVSSGGSASVAIKNKAIDIRNITLFANRNITNASLTVQGVGIENFTIPFPAGNLYKAFTITTRAISNEELNNVTIDFRVNKTKLTEFNASYENVLLYRIPTQEDLWQSLPTVSISEDDEYYYFSSISPGFSTFVIFIAEEEVQCESPQTRCLSNEAQICSENKMWTTSEICNYRCEEGKCISFFSANLNTILISSLVGFLIITLIYYFLKNKKLKKKWKKISS